MRLITLLCTLGLAPFAVGQEYSIQAPDQAHIRQRIEVNWAAPQDTGGMLEIRPIEEGARRVAYAYVRNNPEGIEAPEAPGEYVLVFMFESEVRASAPLTVVMAEATVSGPDSAGAGETLEVSWQGPASRSDNITWAQRNGGTIRGTSYGYVQDATQGSRSLRAPADAGEYDIVYVSGSTILARHPVTVGSIAATVTAPATIHAGGSFEVSFEGPENSGDLITFSDRDGEARNGIGSYTYVGNADGNAVMLRAGETLGAYDVVYESNGRVIGRSPIDIVEASVAIDGPGEVSARTLFAAGWSGAGNAGDRVIIVDPDGDEFDYAYIDPITPEVELVAPEVVGNYTIEYRTRGGSVAASQALLVVPAEVPPGELLVTQARAALGSGDAVEIILDASGSMLQRLGNERRIEIAKRTLTELVNETIPAGTGFVLRVFGHREVDSCRTDLEIPLGPLDQSAATGTIQGINAMNLARTPIGDSIAAARADLADVVGQRVLVVLTDGEETCEGDAASEIEVLRNLGWDIRVNIVGFAIDDAELVQTFESWAAAGGGEYFNATNAEDLGAALLRAVATPFEVLDSNNAPVARGLTGGDPLVLPPGNYRVVASGSEVAVTVVSEETVTAGLGL
ncbi:MAG: VWA domain-containing protein [Gammaproteobacteria bacterium]|nr:VWA domain-containing protein [Pseudomonadales bacterium]